MSEKKDSSISSEQKKYLDHIRRRKKSVLLIQIFVLFFFFLLWELAANYGWIDPFIFSQPTKMFLAAKEMLSDGTLWMHIGTTLWETVAGFFISTILGTLTAVILW